MSSYALLARLSNLEGDASDLQTTIDALSVNKQDTIKNAEVSDGQAIKNGLLLNKIGTKDTTLSIETTGSIIKLAVDKNNIQEKLTAIPDATTTDTTTTPTTTTTSKAVLSNTNVRSIGVDNTLSISEASNVIKVAVDKSKIQEKLTAIPDATDTTTTPATATSKAVLSNATVRSIGVDDTLKITETSNVIKLVVDKSKIQEKLTTIADNDGAKALLVDKTVKGLAADTSINIIAWTEGTLQVSVNKNNIQEKLTGIAGATDTDTNTTSKAVLSSTTVRSIGVDDTLNITETSNVIKLVVDKSKIQEKLTSIADDASAKALLVRNEVKGLATDTTINIAAHHAGTLLVSVKKNYIQEKLTAIPDATNTDTTPTTTSKAVLSSATVRSIGVDDTLNITERQAM